MSKRRSSASGAPADPDSNEPHHNYSDDVKRVCLALLEGKAPIKFHPKQLAKIPGFPGDATLRRWLEEARNPPAVKKITATIGRPPLLSDEELMIVGGFVLFCAERHQTCGGKEITDF